jgi:hypothetical protein
MSPEYLLREIDNENSFYQLMYRRFAFGRCSRAEYFSINAKLSRLTAANFNSSATSDSANRTVRVDPAWRAS